MTESATRGLIGGIALAADVVTVLWMRGGADEQPGATGPEPAPGAPDLAPVRAATERFRDVQVALSEGYVRDPFDLCDTAEMMGRPPELGAMGVHYVRPDLLGITAPPDPRVDGTGIHTDFLTRRSSSTSRRRTDRSTSWRSRTSRSEPPGSPQGTRSHRRSTGSRTTAWRTTRRPTRTRAHVFDPHYDRQVWIYRENPNGVFAPFNPNVTCEHHQGATHPPSPQTTG